MTIFHRRLPLTPGLLLGLALVLVLPLRGEEAAKQAESEKRLRQDITYLASDECEGRGPATKGLDRAADYIANELKKAGLKPGNPDGSYFQPFGIPANTLKAEPTLVFKDPEGKETQLKRGTQFDAMGLTAAGEVTDLPVVFAGYGVGSEAAGYDDYKDIDVAGKVIVVLRNVPQSGQPPAGKPTNLASKLRAQAPFTVKLTRAERNLARAVIFVNDAETAKNGDEIVDFNYTARAQVLDKEGRPTIKIPAFFMQRSMLETMLRGSTGKELKDLEKSIDKDSNPQSVALKGWTVTLKVQTQPGKIPLKNVIGVLEGKGPLANQTVVIGAHYDHLGYGIEGSRARARRGPSTTAPMTTVRARPPCWSWPAGWPPLPTGKGVAWSSCSSAARSWACSVPSTTARRSRSFLWRTPLPCSTSTWLAGWSQTRRPARTGSWSRAATPPAPSRRSSMTSIPNTSCNWPNPRA